MMDLLLEQQQKGLIDAEGINEEVDTFTFEVSLLKINSKSRVRSTDWLKLGTRHHRDGHDVHANAAGRKQRSSGKLTL